MSASNKHTIIKAIAFTISTALVTAAGAFSGQLGALVYYEAISRQVNADRMDVPAANFRCQLDADKRFSATPLDVD